MIARKRRGNLLLVVAIFFILVLTITSLFSFNTAQRSLARIQAGKAGQTNSYVALGNICAGAFQDDLQAMRYTYVIATLDDVTGENINVETYRTAVQRMQDGYAGSSGLSRAEGTEPNSWYHTLTEPSDVVDFSGITDAATISLIERLLKDAEVEILVYDDLALDESAFGNVLEFRFEDIVALQDIQFTVTLKKGSWEIQQDYILSGEKIIATYENNYIAFQIDSSEATLNMVSQTINRFTSTVSTLHTGEDD